MRIGISGTHGTGKTTLAEALSARLPGHVTADEPYYLLEEEGYEFGFPPSPDDYRALLARSLQSLSAQSQQPGAVFDRTPLDYLAYLAATGADPCDEASAAALRPGFASLHLLVITLITPETEQVLPGTEMPVLRAQMNDALLELVYDDPLNAWEDIPVLELTGPLDGRLDAVSLDFDGDGLADDALADFDGDGIADHAVLDLDNDGTAESYFTDDGSGTWSVATDPPARAARPGSELRWFGLDGAEHTGKPLSDFGAEGRAEVRLLDSDGNGLADRAITSGENGVTGYVDTDGDGRWDVKLTDADGDGAADAASALTPKP